MDVTALQKNRMSILPTGINLHSRSDASYVHSLINEMIIAPTTLA